MFSKNIVINIAISLSKIMAYLIFFGSVLLDMYDHTGGENLRFNVPWIAAILGVKQIMDGRLKEKTNV